MLYQLSTLTCVYRYCSSTVTESLVAAGMKRSDFIFSNSVLYLGMTWYYHDNHSCFTVASDLVYAKFPFLLIFQLRH